MPAERALEVRDRCLLLLLVFKRDGGSFTFSEDRYSGLKVGKYSISFKDDLLLISEGQSVVAFFRAPHVISAIRTAGERIDVGCNNGEVLQLRAHWLV